MVSLNRISAFLQSEEIDLDSVQHVYRGDPNTPLALSVTNGTFSWAKDEKHAVLRQIDIAVRAGDFVAVVGPVGSGNHQAGSIIAQHLTVSVLVCSTDCLFNCLFNWLTICLVDYLSV